MNKLPKIINTSLINIEYRMITTLIITIKFKNKILHQMNNTNHLHSSSSFNIYICIKFLFHSVPAVFLFQQQFPELCSINLLHLPLWPVVTSYRIRNPRTRFLRFLTSFLHHRNSTSSHASAHIPLRRRSGCKSTSVHYHSKPIHQPHT